MLIEDIRTLNDRLLVFVPGAVENDDPTPSLIDEPVDAMENTFIDDQNTVSENKMRGAEGEEGQAPDAVERTPMNPISLVPDYDFTPSPELNQIRSPSSSFISTTSISPVASSRHSPRTNADTVSSSPPFLVLSPSPTRVADPETQPDSARVYPLIFASTAPSAIVPSVATPAISLASIPESSTPLPVLFVAAPAVSSSTPAQAMLHDVSTPARTPIAHLLPGRLAPSPCPPTPQDDIQYIPTMDTYILPGLLFPITVQLKQNLCSQCGSRRPNNWCSHLRNAAIKAGVKVVDSPIYMKNLTQLRRNQRLDKTKSGRKQPRKFDLIPMRDLYNGEETEIIQLQLDCSYDLMPRSNVDSVIESVVAQSSINERPSVVTKPIPGDGQSNEELQPEPEARSEEDENAQLWCICRKPSFGEMIGCDNALSCKVEWYHFPCLNIRKAPKGKWFCPQCRSKTSTKRKLEFEDDSEKNLPKKSKTAKTKCEKCGNLLAKSYLKTHLQKYCNGMK